MAPRITEPTVFCSECRIRYPDYTSYDAHRKRKMKAGEGHIHCKICGAEFTHMDTLGRHQKQEHPHEQDLDCPGCHLHFTRLGALMNHIESNQCLKIGQQDIEHGRWIRVQRIMKNVEDFKECVGKFTQSGTGVMDKAAIATDSHQRHLGYIEAGGFTYPLSSIVGPSGKTPEDSILSASIPSSQVQAIRGSDFRLESPDTTGFPPSADAIKPKKQIDSKNGREPSKGKASVPPKQANDIRNTDAQRASGSGQQSGSLNVTEFPTIAEPNVHKGSTEPIYRMDGTLDASVYDEKDREEVWLSKPKKLSDSRWAPNKTTAASSLPRQDQSCHSNLHPIYDRNFLKVRTERDNAKHSDLSCPIENLAVALVSDDPQKLSGSFQQTVNKTLSEQTQTADDKGRSIVAQSRFSHVQEASVGQVEQSELTSHFSEDCKSVTRGSLKTIPPHLRAKILRQGATECSRVSTRPENDHPVHTHLHGGLYASSTAFTEASSGENEASTTRHSDHDTMGLSPVSTRDSRGSSNLPPHLRANNELERADGGGVKSESSDGGVRLDHREKAGDSAAISAEVTTTQIDPASRILTGQSTIGSADRSEVERTELSHSGKAPGDANGRPGLPPHVRAKPGFSGNVSATRPAEIDHSSTTSMSTGHSTPKPVGSVSRSGVGDLATPSDNFRVVQSAESYSTVAKGSEKLPPHLRVKQGPIPMLSTQDATKNAATEISSMPLTHSGAQSAITQTDEASEIRNGVTLKPTDTSMDTLSTMDPEEKGVGLGPHDPEHPSYDARKYRSPYTGRFHCPLPLCGKAFRSMQGITSHLESDVHRRPFTRLQCPHCLRYFKSTTALTQHSESQGRKCEIRNTNEFKHFVDQITAGIADVEGMYEDQTNRYVVTEGAVGDFGEEGMERRAAMFLEQHQRKQIEEKGGNFYDDKHIQW